MPISLSPPEWHGWQIRCHPCGRIHPAHGNYYSHGASFQSTLWLICFGEKGPWYCGAKWHRASFKAPIQRRPKTWECCSVIFVKWVLHKYNVPVVMLSRLSLNPYSWGFTNPQPISHHANYISLKNALYTQIAHQTCQIWLHHVLLKYSSSCGLNDGDPWAIILHNSSW